MNLPKVSICIITYNQGAYIAQALDSALSQKVNFDYEIIIGEDDSDDNTRQIVNDYARRFPNRIRLLLNDRSNVIYIDGRPTGNWNLTNTLNHAIGEYIAILEGDDYWIDESKLQKQVDFLDAHQDYSICFTDAQIWYEGDSKFSSKTFCETFSQSERKPTIEFDDIALGHWIPTASVVYRRKYFREIPSWFLKIPMADWGLFLSLLDKGFGKYLDECTSVYRVHGSSYWSSMTQREREDGRFVFMQLVRNKFGFVKGRAINREYWLLCIERYRKMSGVQNKALWFYYKIMERIWRILVIPQDV